MFDVFFAEIIPISGDTLLTNALHWRSSVILVRKPSLFFDSQKSKLSTLTSSFLGESGHAFPLENPWAKCAELDAQDVLYTYGFYLGLAFQIADDVLDFTGGHVTSDFGLEKTGIVAINKWMIVIVLVDYNSTSI